MNQLYIRQATTADIPCLQILFAIGRRFMAATGNPHQWAPDYPGVALLQADIDSGDSYVVYRSDDSIVAAFVLRGGIDPTYHDIYEGAWLNDAPYATIHRIVSSGEEHGIFDFVMNFALQHYDTVRIDTHRDNVVMQHLLDKAGFRYCGIIHCWNGDERLAYQKL